MTGDLPSLGTAVGRFTEAFELTHDTVIPYLVGRGVLAGDVHTSVVALEGGVSAAVFAVRGPGVAVVAKQALERLNVADDWRANQERTEVEAAAMRLCGRLTPGRVPRLIDNDSASHIVVMELLPDEARNWQTEVEVGRPHVGAGAWAGETLGAWHAQTSGDGVMAAEFDDFE